VVEQTEKIKEMNNGYLTMLDYEKVLNNVQTIIPRLQGGGGDVRASMHGGLQVQQSYSLNDEAEQKLIGGGGLSDELSVNITHVAGTIEADEKERLKKLLFRATRGKALTYFTDYEAKNAAGVTQNKSVYIVVF
jgi:hypothetical protein